MKLKDKYLSDLDFMAVTYPQCFTTNVPSNDIEVGQGDRYYYSDTLKLAAISIDNGKLLLLVLEFLKNCVQITKCQNKHALSQNLLIYHLPVL